MTGVPSSAENMYSGVVERVPTRGEYWAEEEDKGLEDWLLRGCGILDCFCWGLRCCCCCCCFELLFLICLSKLRFEQESLNTSTLSRRFRELNRRSLAALGKEGRGGGGLQLPDLDSGELGLGGVPGEHGRGGVTGRGGEIGLA